MEKPPKDANIYTLARNLSGQKCIRGNLATTITTIKFNNITHQLKGN